MIGNPPLDNDLVQALTFCANASPLITEGLKGNPRQVERFLNAFVLRKKLAQVAKLTNIKDDVLVKLMILEYSHEKRFRQLYEWQAMQQGFPSQIAEMENALRVAAENADKSKEPLTGFSEEWASSQSRRWITMEPSLSGVDLRDYFWVARDRLQSSMAGLSMVPPLVRRLFEGLIGSNTPQRNTAVKGAAELRDDERDLLHDLLDRNIQQKPAEKTGYDAFRHLVEANLQDAAKRMAAAMAKAPVSQVPPAIGTDIDTLVKSKEALPPPFFISLDRIASYDT